MSRVACVAVCVLAVLCAVEANQWFQESCDVWGDPHLRTPLIRDDIWDYHCMGDAWLYVSNNANSHLKGVQMRMVPNPSVHYDGTKQAMVYHDTQFYGQTSANAVAVREDNTIIAAYTYHYPKLSNAGALVKSGNSLDDCAAESSLFVVVTDLEGGRSSSADVRVMSFNNQKEVKLNKADGTLAATVTVSLASSGMNENAKQFLSQYMSPQQLANSANITTAGGTEIRLVNYQDGYLGNMYVKIPKVMQTCGSQGVSGMCTKDCDGNGQLQPWGVATKAQSYFIQPDSSQIPAINTAQWKPDMDVTMIAPFVATSGAAECKPMNPGSAATSYMPLPTLTTEQKIALLQFNHGITKAEAEKYCEVAKGTNMYFGCMQDCALTGDASFVQQTLVAVANQASQAAAAGDPSATPLPTNTNPGGNAGTVNPGPTCADLNYCGAGICFAAVSGGMACKCKAGWSGAQCDTYIGQPAIPEGGSWTNPIVLTVCLLCAVIVLALFVGAAVYKHFHPGMGRKTLAYLQGKSFQPPSSHHSTGESSRNHTSSTSSTHGDSRRTGTMVPLQQV